MKKLLSLLLLSALFIFSCGNKSETKKEQGTAGTKEKIVTSVPPLKWLAQKEMTLKLFQLCNRI